MRWIQKHSSPPDFEQWKVDFEAAYGRHPIYNDLKGKPKRDLKSALIAEQGHICCYCMARVSVDSSHIEHYVPRAETRRDPHSILATDNQLGYENMFVSCEGEKIGETWDGRHCGKAKKDEGTAMLVSPTDPAVASYFSYDTEGNIQGLTPEAMTTVRVLNLQDIALIRHRRKAIFLFVNRNDEDIDDLLEECECITEDGMLPAFCEAIAYILKQLQ